MKKISSKQIRKIIIIITYACLSFLFITIFTQFIDIINENLVYEVEKLLYKDTIHYSKMVRDKVNEYYDSMDDLFITFYDEDNIVGFIGNYVEKNEYIKAAKVIVNNKDYSYNAEVFNGLEDEFISRVYAGDKVVSYIDRDGIEGVIYAVPIKESDKIIGIYEVLQSTDVFKNMLIYNNYYPLITHALIDKNGEKFFGKFTVNNNEKYENFLSRIHVTTETVGEIKNRLKDNEINIIKYKYNGEQIFACYAPVGINDWYLVTEASSDSIKDEKAVIIKASTKLLVKEVLILAILFAHIIYLSYRSRRKANKANSKLKALNDELKISNERYELINKLSKSMIFEYNYATDEVYVTDNYIETFGENLKEIRWAKDSIYTGVNSDDVIKFNQLKNINDDDYRVVEFRKQNTDGEVKWYRLYAKSILDNNMHPVKLIGRINDINKEVLEKDRLKKMAENDMFTSLLNKESTRKYINFVLSSDGGNKHAFIIIDIDNLKTINDKSGHISGDKAIIFVAQKIKYAFRQDDIIGRIGGDEFIVLMKNFTSKKDVVKKLNVLCGELTKENCVDGYCVTVSIGISFYPMDAISYEELYEKADIALYLSKKGGKNTFSFYR